MQNLARDEAGNVWELDAQGNAVRMVEPAAPAVGRVFSLPPNPKEVRQESRQAAADARAEAAAARAQANADRTAANEAERLRLAKAEEDRKAREWIATHLPDGTPRPKPANADPKAVARVPKLNALVEQIRRVESLYNQNLAPEAMGILSSLGDYLPTEENKQFDAAAAGLAEQGLAAFRVPGVGAQSDAELRQFVQANKPSATNYDTTIEEKLRQLKVRVDAERQRLGMDPVDWDSTDQKADNELLNPANNADLKPPAPGLVDPNSNRPGGGPRERTAIATEDRIVRDPRVSAQVDALINAGASMATINAVLKRQNFPPLIAGDFAKAKQWMRDNPGKRYYGSDPTRLEELNPLQKAAGSPVGAFVAHAGNMVGAGFPGAVAGPTGQGALDAMSAAHPGSSLAGGVVGGVSGSLVGGLGAVKAAAQLAPRLVGAAPIVGDTAYGALTGAMTAREGEGGVGALIGGAAGLGGGLIGMGIGKGLSRFGGPQMSGADQSIYGTVKGDLPVIRPQLDEAQSLNMPMALADADPRLRALAGSVSRKSIDARELAERTFDPRARAQAERAIAAIDSHLAPSGDIDAIAAAATGRARDASADLYAAAKGQPAPDMVANPQLDEILRTPAGEAALRRAYNTALNDRVNPAELSISMGMDGKPIIQGNPTWQTLHYVRRGLDAEIDEAIDPVTRTVKPGMSDAQGSMIGLRRALDEQIGTLNPVFKEADAKFAEFAQQGTAARQGYSASSPRVRPDTVEGVVGNMPEANLPFYQQGYASSLGDIVERARLAGNPYDAIYGSTGQQQKIGTVFPEGAPTFNRVADLEREMAKTRYEVMGGSPTAARLQADEQIGGGLGTAALDLGSQIMTGGGLNLGSLLSAGRRMAGDAMKLGVGKQAVKRADEIAPVLYNTDPASAAAYLDDLLARAAARAARSQTAGQIGSGFGSGILTPLTVGQ